MGTTSSRFLQKNIESCVRLGIEEASLIALVPGGSAALENPAQRFDGEILVSVLGAAESLSGDSAIGLRCGLNHRNTSYQDMPNAVQFCNNLGDSFAFTQRYEPLVQQYSEHFLTLRETEADITLRAHEDAPEKLRHVLDLSFSTLATMSMWVKAVHGLKIQKLKVCHQNTSYETLYSRLFECPVEYGADVNLVTFDRKFLDIPLPSADPETLKIITNRLDRDLETMGKPISDEAQVTFYLESLLGVGSPTIQNVATKMGMSERSVRRRLKDCGTSFRQVLEKVRQERYSFLIRQADLTQVQIAGMLGYSEQSALSRAYKKWHGTSPAQDRKDLVSEI